MHQFRSLYNTGPQACEAPTDDTDKRFRTCIAVSVLLHLVFIYSCVHLHWSRNIIAPAIAGNAVITIDLRSIPARIAPDPEPMYVNTTGAETPGIAQALEASRTLALPSKTEKTTIFPSQDSKPAPPQPETQQVPPEPSLMKKEATEKKTDQSVSSAPDSATQANNEAALANTVSSVTSKPLRFENVLDGCGQNSTGKSDNAAIVESAMITAQRRASEKRYVDENFYYVKDLITRNLTYPAVARRMKWQGTVVVAFTVLEDGTAEHIDVITSSGHSILDKNVIATIRQVQPFPVPPAAAEFTMPIRYALRP